MKIREPFTIFLFALLAVGAVSTHVNKNQVQKRHALQTHYLKNHKQSYDAEAALRLKQRAELDVATKYKLKDI